MYETDKLNCAPPFLINRCQLIFSEESRGRKMSEGSEGRRIRIEERREDKSHREKGCHFSDVVAILLLQYVKSSVKKHFLLQNSFAYMPAVNFSNYFRIQY